MLNLLCISFVGIVISMIIIDYCYNKQIIIEEKFEKLQEELEGLAWKGKA